MQPRNPSSAPGPAPPRPLTSHPPAGLLLNNLSVYRGCEIVFDSMDVPEDSAAAASQMLALSPEAVEQQRLDADATVGGQRAAGWAARVDPRSG